MTLRTFERFVAPYLDWIGVPSVETVCVIREPVDWLGSWYRYNARHAIRKEPRSTRRLLICGSSPWSCSSRKKWSLP